MSLIDDLRPALTSIRAIPGQLGLRPYTVQVVTDAWDGDELGQGTETTTATTISESGGQPPKVRFLSSQERALAGLSNSSVEVGPITPSHTGGGTALSALLTLPKQGSTNTIYNWILTGPAWPNGARFRVVSHKSDRAGHFLVTLDKAADE